MCKYLEVLPSISDDSKVTVASLFAPEGGTAVVDSSGRSCEDARASIEDVVVAIGVDVGGAVVLADLGRHNPSFK